MEVPDNGGPDNGGSTVPSFTRLKNTVSGKERPHHLSASGNEWPPS